MFERAKVYFTVTHDFFLKTLVVELREFSFFELSNTTDTHVFANIYICVCICVQSVLHLFYSILKCKLVGIDWSLLSSPSYTYTYCSSLIGAKI